MGIIDLLFSSPIIFFIYLSAVVYGISIHEFFHAYAAYRAGDTDQVENKRLTLNPIRHIDIFGILTLILFGIGWGKPVYINVNKFRLQNVKFNLYMVAIAGILANFGSALFFAFILKMLFVFNIVTADNLFVLFLKILININISLAVFNLIPIPPLDGAKVLSLILPARFDNFKIFLARNGNIILMAILFFSVIFNFSIFSYLINPVIDFVNRLFGV